MDKLEIALQEESQLLDAILKQPLEGLLYDLDLMPEQCRNATANMRRITVEELRKEIERLRKEKEWLLKQYATELYDAHKAIRTTYNRDSIKQRIVLEMQQALKERE
ncbi:hypothetical protein LCGC14_2178760 [marine sediment metagenome]|uniref:Uncharacterized protein n=1 Tax=marine sediment metagenome TaxID=412755 RepID=A0A0F9DMW3_9ZZZZ